MITGEDIDRLYEEAHPDDIHKDDTVRFTRRAEQMSKVFDPVRPDVPALTTLMFLVCGSDHETFERIIKLVQAFMDQAEKDALKFMEKQK